MSRTVKPSFRPVTSGFVVTGSLRAEPSACQQVADAIRNLLKLWLRGRIRHLHWPTSDRFVRFVLDGANHMTIEFFLNALDAAFKLGEIKGAGLGRERVRRVAQWIVGRYGLTVGIAEQRPPKDPQSEAIESAVAHAAVLDALQRALPRGITAAERQRIEGAVMVAHSELDDVVRSLTVAEVYA